MTMSALLTSGQHSGFSLSRDALNWMDKNGSALSCCHCRCQADAPNMENATSRDTFKQAHTMLSSHVTAPKSSHPSIFMYGIALLKTARYLRCQLGHLRGGCDRTGQCQAKAGNAPTRICSIPLSPAGAQSPCSTETVALSGTSHFLGKPSRCCKTSLSRSHSLNAMGSG